MAISRDASAVSAMGRGAASFARLLAWGEVSSSSSFCEPSNEIRTRNFDRFT